MCLLLFEAFWLSVNVPNNPKTDETQRKTVILYIKSHVAVIQAGGSSHTVPAAV